jgi:hypothetical protein
LHATAKHLREGERLRAADFVEWNIGLPLEAPFVVPESSTVSRQIQPNHAESFASVKTIVEG